VLDERFQLRTAFERFRLLLRLVLSVLILRHLFVCVPHLGREGGKVMSNEGLYLQRRWDDGSSFSAREGQFEVVILRPPR
jgi:hypothetical protein